MKKQIICKTIVPIKDLSSIADVRDAEYIKTPIDFIDCVILEPGDFKAIFGVKRAQVKDADKALGVVKIKSLVSGKVIYRRYYGERALKDKKMAAVTYASIYQLGDGKHEMIRSDVLLSKGSKIPFFWYNPIYAVKISMRLGTISAGLGVLSILFGILSICISKQII